MSSLYRPNKLDLKKWDCLPQPCVVLENVLITQVDIYYKTFHHDFFDDVE